MKQYHTLTTDVYKGLPIPSGWTLQELRDCLEKTKEALTVTSDVSYSWSLLVQQQDKLQRLINDIETSEV
jgi:hypothetical protein